MHTRMCMHTANCSLFFGLVTPPSSFHCGYCAVLPISLFGRGELEAQRHEEIGWCHGRPRRHGAGASISQGHSGFECNNEHKNTLRTGQDRQVLVPGTSGSCGGEAWVRTGQGSSQLESWPCTCLSGDIASAPKRPPRLLLQQQPAWGPAPQSLRARLLTIWHQDLLNISGWKVPSLLSPALIMGSCSQVRQAVGVGWVRSLCSCAGGA